MKTKIENQETMLLATHQVQAVSEATRHPLHEPDIRARGCAMQTSRMHKAEPLWGASYLRSLAQCKGQAAQCKPRQGGQLLPFDVKKLPFDKK